MLIFALALVAPTALTNTHQRDIACVVEIAILANAEKRGLVAGSDMQTKGRQWAGVVGDRITFETGQPKEVVGFALNEAAKARAGRAADAALQVACTRQMNTELALADAANAPLPKPIKAQ